MDQITHARRRACVGIQHIYLTAFIASVIGMLMVLIMKILLRRTFGPAAAPPAAPAAGIHKAVDGTPSHQLTLARRGGTRQLRRHGRRIVFPRQGLYQTALRVNPHRSRHRLPPAA
jgi:hypothetical protein